MVSDTARWLTLTTPNHEAFFHAAGEQALERALPPQTAPDTAKVMAVAEQLVAEILGPPHGGDPHRDH